MDNLNLLMNIKSVELKKSIINGKGVFAKRDFKKRRDLDEMGVVWFIV